MNTIQKAARAFDNGNPYRFRFGGGYVVTSLEVGWEAVLYIQAVDTGRVHKIRHSSDGPVHAARVFNAWSWLGAKDREDADKLQALADELRAEGDMYNAARAQNELHALLGFVAGA